MWLCKILCVLLYLRFTFSDSRWRESVLFEELHAIHTSQARWKITLIQDVSIFPTLIHDAEQQLQLLTDEINTHLPGQDRKIVSSTTSTLRLIPQELDQLRIELNWLKLKTQELYHLGEVSAHRKFRRSLLPFLGQAASYLFGTVSEQDLAVIQSNLHRLNNQQNQVVHVVSQALTLMNVSQAAIHENRQALNAVITTITELRNIYYSYKTATDSAIGMMRARLNLMFRCTMAISRARVHVRQLQAYYDMLLFNLNIMTTSKLTTNLITPRQLSTLLSNLKQRLPAALALAADPVHRVWHYYKSLHVDSAFQDGSLIFVIDLPLIHIDSQFNLFKIHSFPVAAPNHIPTGLDGATIQYKVDNAAIAINFGRTKYFLLSKEELKVCMSSSDAYCRINKPLYLTVAKLHCEISLFLPSLPIKCESHLRQDLRLPQVEFLSKGVWVIITRHSFKLTIGCPTGTEQIKSVFGPYTIVSVNQSCYGTSDFFYIPAYYELDSRQELKSDGLILSRVVPQFGPLWDVIGNITAGRKAISIPAKLKELDTIPVERLISSLKLMDDTELASSGEFNWLAVVLPIVGVILVIVALGILKWKFGVHHVVSANVDVPGEIEVLRSDDVGVELNLATAVPKFVTIRE